MKLPALEPEIISLSMFERTGELLHTKNVHEASVLDFGRYSVCREIGPTKKKGETACAISPSTMPVEL